MGQTSDPETLVIHQKLTPGNNPKKKMLSKNTYFSPVVRTHRKIIVQIFVHEQIINEITICLK
jgi:hypothetical protein